MTSRNKTVREAGFTLLEMTVVMAIMGVALLLVAHFLQPHSHWLETKAAAQNVANAMRTSRDRAIAQGEKITLAMPSLPPWLGVTVEAPPGGIVFAPDGSSSGGRVLLNDNGRDIAVTADWLTGRVSINDR
jgi:general secretion pathway protein H